MIQNHDSGKKPASPAELEAARATLHRLGASERAPSAPRIPPGHSSITMADADMKTLAAACALHFGGPVAVSDRLARRAVSLRITTPTEAELRSLLHAELLRQEIALLEVPGGKRLEAVAPAAPAK